MYSNFPKADRLKIRAGLAATWGFLAVSGAGGLLFPPQSIVEHTGVIPHTITAVVLLVSSLIGFAATVLNRYRVEWAAAYFAVAGLAVYVFAVWSIVIMGETGRMQQAGALSALIGFCIYRIAACASHSRFLKKQHRTLEAIER